MNHELDGLPRTLEAAIRRAMLAVITTEGAMVWLRMSLFVQALLTVGETAAPRKTVGNLRSPGFEQVSSSESETLPVGAVAS